MRLTSFGVVGLFIIAALLFVQSLQMDELVALQGAEYYVDKVVQHAAEDAATALKASAQKYAESNRLLSVEQPAVAVRSFMDNLANSLNMTSREDLVRLSSYIPYIAIVDQKGYYIYAVVQSERAGHQYERQVLPRIDFVHQMGDYYIFLGDAERVKLLYREAGVWVVNYKSRSAWALEAKDASVRQFFAAPDYAQRVANLKRIQLEADLARIVNLHCDYAKCRGLYYDFTFAPSAGSWNGVVERPSIVAALQGLPLTERGVYDATQVYHFALEREASYCGFVVNGVKYYAVKADLPVAQARVEEVFSSAQAAAKSGYYPYRK